MFAGGRVTTWGQLAIGSPATLQSRVVSRTQKQGRSGPLWFMTVRNDYHQHGRLIIRDERDLVYRPPLPAEAKPGTRSQSDIGPWEVPAEPGGIDMAIDPTVLFRFSALTYNAHRIHYDPDWARAEGYGGLVVHGPLQALLLGERARRGGVDLVGRCFAYRLVAPFIAGALLRVRTCGTDEAAVFDPAGVMTAKASISDAGDPNT